ncbi:hypothetical protein [Amycolatopsis sp. Hca4]|uniref:hypothetical protein n=1 Tax=Amycolatopsis sp. Hca4 TaxID=2742131 RepID=UPI0015911C7F|nr:hypothetical protein [Amycolatopsis sp. Hca4]QKV80236.1 hypothetical protein HUT10_45420 [Amycolatopsis sp. Hca4]
MHRAPTPKRAESIFQYAATPHRETTESQEGGTVFLFEEPGKFAGKYPRFPENAPRFTFVDEVFGISRELPMNYVERDKVDNKLFLALNQNHHIVIHGSSKQGKTCLRKWNIKDKPHVVVACIEITSLAELNAAILKAVGYRVEKSSSTSVSGKSKINAKVDVHFKAPGFDMTTSTGEESERSREQIQTTEPLELDPEDINDMIRALESIEFDSLIILEDFHYLPSVVQKSFSRALKGYFDYSAYRFVMIGVWLDDNKLLRFNGDLGSRIATVNADHWSRTELEDVIEKGENLIGLKFESDFCDYVLENCLGSVWVVQQVCYQACIAAGIIGDSGREIRPVGSLELARKLMQDIVRDQSSRSTSFIDGFSAGPNAELAEIYRWALYAVIASDVARLEGGLQVEEIVNFIDSFGLGAGPRQRDLLAELPNIAEFQMHHLEISPIVLDYDFGARRLNVVDRSFLIWLNGQDRVEILREADMPGNSLRHWQRVVHDVKNAHHKPESATVGARTRADEQVERPT